MKMQKEKSGSWHDFNPPAPLRKKIKLRMSHPVHRNNATGPKYTVYLLGSSSDTKAASTPSPSLGGNSLHKKSILIGKRPGLGISSMLSQFKNYSESKKNPILSQRPSVFCSPDGEEEDEEVDDSSFLEVKGNS